MWLCLKQGLVPADIRLMETAQLKAEEAALTGESVGVEKHAMAINEEHFLLQTGKTWFTREQRSPMAVEPVLLLQPG